jgi:uncharacterized protein (TIGR03032 family)
MSETVWAAHERELRDPAQAISLLVDPLPDDASALDAEEDGPFWELIGGLGATILVTREYEHFVVALSHRSGRRRMSSLRLPHPSGLVVDRGRGRVFVALTRNPNQVMELRAASTWMPREDRAADDGDLGLVPVATKILPGCFYLHDLAILDGRVVGNAVGMNAVVELSGESPTLAWWPIGIEVQGRPNLCRNLIQLNSIAAGEDLAASYFTASTEQPGLRRPGDPDWEVTRQGVIFSGRTRDVVARGLTRPHSARLADDASVWVADSGFGTLNVLAGDRTTPVVSLPGWTRGLCLIGRYALVGTSRVIPRFAQYAPGLDTARSRCGVHVVDVTDGRRIASLYWPRGNQIFAIDWMPDSASTGFLAGSPSTDALASEAAWYHFSPPGSNLDPESPLEHH